jgi:putative membrane protein
MSPAPDDWHRLHPLTPLLRGGRVLLLLAALVGQQGLRQGDGLRPAFVGLGSLAVTALAVGVGYVVWRTTRYRLTATELQVESGLLKRRSRRVPLARLQSVDVVRPIIARIAGLAELRLEVVGGGSSEAPLAYLADEDAQRLRRAMLASGREEEVVARADDAVLVQVPTGALVASALLGPPLVIALLLLPCLVAVALVAPAAAVPFGAAVLPAYAGVFAVAGRRVLAEYGFSVAETPDGLRLRHGLLDTRTQTIPPGRVQAVRLLEPLLWRPWGWVRVEVDVAGYAGRGEEQSATSALLPVAPRQLAEALVGRVLGGGLPVAAAPVPERARWRAPLSRRRLRAGLDDRHLVTTSGVLTTTTDVVPLAKVQSLRLTAGPWQQRLGLTTLHVDTAGRRLPGAKAHHRDAAEAAALLDELSRRTRAARRLGTVPATRP